MAFTIVPVLVRIGLFGSAVEGGRFLYRAAARSVAGTRLEPVISGPEVVARSLFRELGPLDPFRLLDEENGILSGKALAPATLSAVPRAVAKAATICANRPIASGAAVAGSEASIYAAAGRRYAELSRRFGERAMAAHSVASDCPEALKLAEQSLALAGASRNPPRDPRAVLSSEHPPSVQSALTDLIDSCNRVEEPDLSKLESRLLEVSVAGKAPCCDACAKKSGPCASGKCGVTEGHSHVSNDMLFGPATAGPGDDDDDDGMSDDADDDDLDSVEDLAGSSFGGKSCPTGACWNK